MKKHPKPASGSPNARSRPAGPRGSTPGAKTNGRTNTQAAAKPASRGKRGKKPRVRHEFSAGFVLFRDTAEGRLYLLLDYGRHWDYPKGHLEKGETAWQAAVRELREETGIRAVDRAGTFQRDMHYDFYSPKKGRVMKTVTYFAGRTSAADVTLSDEHAGYVWLPYEDALQKLTYDNARTMLRAAHEATREPSE